MMYIIFSTDAKLLAHKCLLILCTNIIKWSLYTILWAQDYRDLTHSGSVETFAHDENGKGEQMTGWGS